MSHRASINYVLIYFKSVNEGEMKHSFCFPINVFFPIKKYLKKNQMVDKVDVSSLYSYFLKQKWLLSSINLMGFCNVYLLLFYSCDNTPRPGHWK